MKIIEGPRGSGRTTALVREFLKDPSGAVIASPFDGWNIRHILANAMLSNAFASQVIRLPQDIRRTRGGVRVFVDDLDILNTSLELLPQVVAATVEAPVANFERIP